jgi:hypothetical protein
MSGNTPANTQTHRHAYTQTCALTCACPRAYAKTPQGSRQSPIARTTPTKKSMSTSTKEPNSTEPILAQIDTDEATADSGSARSESHRPIQASALLRANKARSPPLQEQEVDKGTILYLRPAESSALMHTAKSNALVHDTDSNAPLRDAERAIHWCMMLIAVTSAQCATQSQQGLLSSAPRAGSRQRYNSVPMSWCYQHP